MKQVDISIIIEIVNKVLKNDSLTFDNINDDLTKFGMSSLEFVRLIVAIEEAFECEIPDSYLILFKMNTLNKIKTILEGIYADNHEK